MAIERYDGTRYWAVYDQKADLVCLCVYKKGATEVSRRLGISPDQVGEANKDVSPQTVSDKRADVYRRSKR